MNNHKPPESVVPGKLDWFGRDAVGQEVRKERYEAEGVDGFGGQCQLLDRPPAVFADPLALEGFESAGVDLVRGDAVEEEVVAEHSGGPAEVGITGRHGDTRRRAHVDQRGRSG